MDDFFDRQIPKGTDLFGDHVSLVRLKASTEFFGQLFETLNENIPKRDFYRLAAEMRPDEIHPEVVEKLNLIHEALN